MITARRIVSLKFLFPPKEGSVQRRVETTGNIIRYQLSSSIFWKFQSQKTIHELLSMQMSPHINSVTTPGSSHLNTAPSAKGFLFCRPIGRKGMAGTLNTRSVPYFQAQKFILHSGNFAILCAAW